MYTSRLTRFPGADLMTLLRGLCTFSRRVRLEALLACSQPDGEIIADPRTVFAELDPPKRGTNYGSRRNNPLREAGVEIQNVASVSTISDVLRALKSKYLTPDVPDIQEQ